MVPRWMAARLFWAKTGFRGIRHAEDLPRLAAERANRRLARRPANEELHPSQPPTALTN